MNKNKAIEKIRNQFKAEIKVMVTNRKWGDITRIAKEYGYSRQSVYNYIKEFDTSAEKQ